MTCKPKGKEDKQMQNKKKAGWGSCALLACTCGNSRSSSFSSCPLSWQSPFLRFIHYILHPEPWWTNTSEPMWIASRLWSLNFLINISRIGVVGVLANYGFSLIMADSNVDHATLSAEPALLPACRTSKYFDTHQHGDIMVHLYIDIDALRHAIEQSILQPSPPLRSPVSSQLRWWSALLLLNLSMVDVMAYVIKDISG